MTTQAELEALIQQNEDAFYALSGNYEVLLGGVPTLDGYAFLMGSIIETNYGSNAPEVEFNKENAFINVANSLVSGNAPAADAFEALLGSADTLTEQVEALYHALVHPGVQSEEGIAWLTRSDALQFYQDVAEERGVAGDHGAAVVSFGSMLAFIQGSDLAGLGDTLNDLRAAVKDGSAEIPTSGSAFTPAEDADGVNFDNDQFISTVGVSDDLSGAGGGI